MIAFYTVTGGAGLVDRAVAAFRPGSVRVSHCEPVLASGVGVCAHPVSGVTLVHRVYGAPWLVLPVAFDEDAALRYVGARYNYVGAVGAGLGMQLGGPGYHCSQLCAELLGMPQACAQHPADVARWCGVCQ